MILPGTVVGQTSDSYSLIVSVIIILVKYFTEVPVVFCLHGLKILLGISSDIAHNSISAYHCLFFKSGCNDPWMACL